MARNTNTVGNTFLVAFLLCVVCSVLVASAAVLLRPRQEANRLLDKKRNIVLAAGFGEDYTIEQAFAQIEARIVDLGQGTYVDGIDPETYDFVAAAADRDLGVAIPADQDRAGIKRRARYMPVYLVKRRGQVDKVILPIYGKGLWSTLYGFITLDRKDLNTIRSLLFYEHAETPGLGGEVDNPSWKALWRGKKAYTDDGQVAIQVVRGAVDRSAPDAVYKVDGLSGATLTSRGVQNMLHYWLSGSGYGRFLDNLRTQRQGEA